MVKCNGAKANRGTKESSNLLQNGQRLHIPTGFYAAAYDVSTAGIEGLTGTVISYRGTNADTGATIAANDNAATIKEMGA